MSGGLDSRLLQKETQERFEANRFQMKRLEMSRKSVSPSPLHSIVSANSSSNSRRPPIFAESPVRDSRPP